MKPTLTPAYGRDYKSRAAIEADLAAGKDFVANLMGGSTYCGLAEIESEGWTSVNVRYSKLRKIAVVDVKRVLKLRSKRSREQGESGTARVCQNCQAPLTSKGNCPDYFGRCGAPVEDPHDTLEALADRPQPDPETRSWQIQVSTAGDPADVWSSNGLRFLTRADAEAWALGRLLSWRVVSSSEEPNR